MRAVSEKLGTLRTVTWSRRWDILVFAGLIAVILPVGTAVTGELEHLTWIGVAFAVLFGALLCRWLDPIIPAELRAGGASERAMHWLAPRLCIWFSLTWWFTFGPAFAGALSTATAFLLIRRWRRTRAIPKSERNRPVPPAEHYSWFAAALASLSDLCLSVLLAVAALIFGAEITTAVAPSVERWAGSLPGGGLTIFGQPMLARVILVAGGIVFGFLVTSGLAKAIPVGMRDAGLPRVVQYAWACLPFAIGVFWSIRQPNLFIGCATSLVLLIVLGVWTKLPPEDALNRMTVAVLALRHGPRAVAEARRSYPRRPPAARADDPAEPAAPAEPDGTDRSDGRDHEVDRGQH